MAAGHRQHRRKSGKTSFQTIGQVQNFRDFSDPAVFKLLDAGEEIRQRPEPIPSDKAFLTKYLVQVTLPHSNPGNGVPVFRRKNGDITLTVTPAFDDNNQPLHPYGTVPRLLLFWLTREALRQKSHRIELSDSINGFLLDLGMNPANGSGKRSDARRMRDQMERLFRARISIDAKLKDGTRSGHAWQDMQVAKAATTWWDYKCPEQGSFFDSWVELDRDFYEAILSDPVPVDMRALRELKRSPMALDLYAWATYQTFVITRRGKGRKVPWRGLMQQLGAEYSDYKDFRKAAIQALKKVQMVFPGLLISDATGGFVIHPSQPSILPKE